MNGIFISYRRDDAAGYAGRLYDRLATRFGGERVFMDVEGIEPGTDFVEAIERAVGSCEVLIVIIGSDWLNAVDASGQRRLDDPADFVRLEAAAALARNIRVVPVLVEGAVMPRADQLPPELAPLARRQAVELSHKQWDSSSGELIATLERILERDKPSAPAEQSPAPSVARTALPPPAPIGPDLRKWGIAAAILLAIGGTLALLRPWREEAKAPTAQQPAAPAKSAEPPPALASAPPATVSPQPPAAAPSVPAAQQPIAAETKPAPAPAAPAPAPAAPPAKTTPATPPVVAAPVQPKAEAAPPPRIVRFESKRAGDKLLLCYGVANAVEAVITPQPGAVKPSAQECVSVATEARQTYTLSARNAAGSVVTRSVTVDVPPSPPAERLVAVPELIGKPRREAVAELERAGFQVRVVEDELDPQASGAAGSVVAQLPRGGEQLQAGGRVTLQIMSEAPPQAAIAPSPLPRVGDTWQYRYSSIWKNVEPRTFVHSVTAVSEREIRETMSLGPGGKAVESKAFGPEARFVEWRGAGYYRPEFNPFLQSFGALQTGSGWRSLATPVEDPFYGDWYTQGRVVGWDSVVVPAGSFKALRVELNSNRNASGSPAMLASEPVRVWHVVWYAADAKRTVKHMRTVFSAKGGKLDEDTYELVKYQLR